MIKTLLLFLTSAKKPVDGKISYKLISLPFVESSGGPAHTQLFLTRCLILGSPRRETWITCQHTPVFNKIEMKLKSFLQHL